MKFLDRDNCTSKDNIKVNDFCHPLQNLLKKKIFFENRHQIIAENKKIMNQMRDKYLENNNIKTKASNKNIVDKNIVDKNSVFYFPDIGITKFKIPIYTPFFSDLAKVFFKILNSTSLEYYVFAGSAIGMVRDGNNIPWVDDYDILIFEDQLHLYKTKVARILERHGFKIHYNEKLKGYFTTSLKYNDVKYVFDIFVSSENSFGIVQNISKIGRYHQKGIPINIIKPAKYLEFDNMGFKIPFFNKFEKDVEFEYGNVIDNIDIHIKHRGNNKIRSHYSKVYKDFDNIKENAIINTRKQIETNDISHKYLNKLVIKSDDQFTDRIKLLQFIYENDIGKIFILSNSFVKFTYSIKYYFPKIQIILYIYKDFKQITPIMLNKIDIVRVPNDDILKQYTNYIFYVNKPLFELITVITFGSFDLFHKGHKNILQKSRDICSKLVVGVSSDSFNKQKGKDCKENYEIRKNNLNQERIANIIFKEESFNKKQYYCHNYKANLLVMGSDWENKFDFLDIPTLYFPRTENISSTKIRNNLKN